MDEDNPHHFWLQHRNTDIHNDELTRRIADSARVAFEEDRVILEAVHLGMKHKTSPTTGLMLDASASRFRRGLTERIRREEAAPGATQPQVSV